MDNVLSWQGLPYYPINQLYKKVYGEKVYKIPVSMAQTCPNREGLKGMKLCVFCDHWGSAAFPENRQLSLKEQVIKNKQTVRIRNKVNQFLIYFQSYTNTFQKVSQLRSQILEALNFDDVVGIVVGTRPDCISESVFKLWNEIAETKSVYVEIGVQSLNEQDLKWMERGHSGDKSIWAIKKIKEKCPKIKIGVHLIFGMPNETEEEVIQTAKIFSELGVNDVKLHNLHVLKGTPLEEIYNQGNFEPISMEDYAKKATLFLQHLDPNIAVHRLSAVASRHEELVAPKWTARKMYNYQYFIDHMRDQGIYQGQFFS
ncbi:MAG: TIGR01212 family radical SAM protein [Bdellovibrionaceae bacterium]|jgi:uncharacterized protein|nr:TIGR01212 family radical SAM protein [Pseudobdellovibrionaceae bacterium]